MKKFPFNPKCAEQITVKNGFTLAEVRKIRRELRVLVERDLWDQPTIYSAVSWGHTPQGVAYWRDIYARISVAQLELDAPPKVPRLAKISTPEPPAPEEPVPVPPGFKHLPPPKICGTCLHCGYFHTPRLRCNKYDYPVQKYSVCDSHRFPSWMREIKGATM